MNSLVRLCAATVGILMFVAAPSGCGEQQPEASSTPETTASTPQPSVPPSESPESTKSPQTRRPTTPPTKLMPCRATDLVLSGADSSGAAGHIGYRTVVTNTGTRSCALLGDPVVVVYVDSTGRTRTLPTERHRADGVASPILQRGQRAEMTLLVVNGYGGYDRSAPACAHPAVYRNLSAKLRGGGMVGLDGLVLDVKCGAITAYDWVGATSVP